MSGRVEQIGVVQYVKAGLLLALAVALPVAANRMVGLFGAIVSAAVFCEAVWLFKTRGVADRPLPGRVGSRSDWLQIVAGLMILGLAVSVIAE